MPRIGRQPCEGSNEDCAGTLECVGPTGSKRCGLTPNSVKEGDGCYLDSDCKNAVGQPIVICEGDDGSSGLGVCTVDRTVECSDFTASGSEACNGVLNKYGKTCIYTTPYGSVTPVCKQKCDTCEAAVSAAECAATSDPSSPGGCMWDTVGNNCRYKVCSDTGVTAGQCINLLEGCNWLVVDDSAPYSWYADNRDLTYECRFLETQTCNDLNFSYELCGSTEACGFVTTDSTVVGIGYCEEMGPEFCAHQKQRIVCDSLPVCEYSSVALSAEVRCVSVGTATECSGYGSSSGCQNTQKHPGLKCKWTADTSGIYTCSTSECVDILAQGVCDGDADCKWIWNEEGDAGECIPQSAYSGCTDYANIEQCEADTTSNTYGCYWRLEIPYQAQVGCRQYYGPYIGNITSNYRVPCTSVVTRDSCLGTSVNSKCVWAAATGGNEDTWVDEMFGGHCYHNCDMHTASSADCNAQATCRYIPGSPGACVTYNPITCEDRAVDDCTGKTDIIHNRCGLVNSLCKTLGTSCGDGLT